MKALKSLLAVVLLATSSTLFAQAHDDEPYLIRSFSPDGLRNVKVETSGGNVAVVGQNGGEARIEMYVRGNNWNDKLSDAEIKERLEKYYQVTIDKDATTLTAIAKRTNNGTNWREGLSISFKVYVPSGVASNLKTSGGNVSLANLSGQQEAVTSGGNISLDNVKGNATVRTSGGNIDIETFAGNLEAVTSGGNLKAEGVKGDLKLKTSGGNIGLANVAGSVEAETSGGNIGADITELGERLSLSTSAGNVHVNMPLDKGIDLDLKGSKVHIAMNNFKGVLEDDRVQGQLNGGGVPVRIRTSGGNVNIN